MLDDQMEVMRAAINVARTPGFIEGATKSQLEQGFKDLIQIMENALTAYDSENT